MFGKEAGRDKGIYEVRPDVILLKTLSNKKPIIEKETSRLASLKLMWSFCGE
jgi:hypothetical protein